MEYNNNPYGNFKMISVDGIFLSYTDAKRMKWYLDRGLATQLDDYYYQLNFVTAGNGNSDRDPFYSVPSKNECVVCGSKEELTRHHVVPSQYRKLLPDKYKSRMSFDIVCICNTCHNAYEAHADILKDKMINEFGLKDYVKNHIHVKRYRNTLKYYDYEIPEERKQYMIEFIESVSDDTLENILSLEKYTYRNFNEEFMSHINDVEGFIVMWREHFLECAKPKFIAPEWIDAIKRNFY